MSDYIKNTKNIALEKYDTTLTNNNLELILYDERLDKFINFVNKNIKWLYLEIEKLDDKHSE